jgi:N-acetylneuraminic acid mutarotase
MSFSRVEAYDPATDTWERKADMPTERMFFSTSVVGGKIYAIGGSKGTINGFVAFNTVEAYDPATDTWEQRTSIPTARTMFSTSVVNGKVYAIGGMNGGGFFSTNS